MSIIVLKRKVIRVKLNSKLVYFVLKLRCPDVAAFIIRNIIIIVL